MANEKRNFKTGFTINVDIPVMTKIEDYVYKLRTSKGEIARRIFEHFIKHNAIEDLKA